RVPNMIFAIARRPVHSARVGDTGEIHYPWHPLVGCRVRIDYTEHRRGELVAICEMPDGSRAVIPAWMLDRVACATLTTGPRRCWGARPRSTWIPRDAMRSADLPEDVLQRRALIYVRQSTVVQVQDNLESRRRQYALADLARTYGFSDVVTIDDDLGRSASG